jgi:hypothetical protein
MAKQEEFVHKVTLSTGKVVLVRQPKISTFELACKAVGKRAEGNTLLQGAIVSKEVVKLLIAQIDDKPVSHNDLHDLDKVFSPLEYRQLQKVVQQLSGDDEGDNDPKIETAISGET